MAGSRLTGRGQAINERVLDVLQQAGRALSPYEILGRLNATGRFHPTSVYRSLAWLVSEGEVHKVESQGAFVPCTARHHAGEANALLVCRQCGRTEELSAHGAMPAVSDAATVGRFHIEHLVVEAQGLCAQCRAAGPPKTLRR